jgi:hypothetical protein
VLVEVLAHLEVLVLQEPVEHQSHQLQ